MRPALTRRDDPSIGGGRSMFAPFADVMAASQYGPVMLAHDKPDNGSQGTFDADMATVLTDSFLRNAVAHGLFALSFMDDHNLSASPTSFEVVANAVRQYGVTP